MTDPYLTVTSDGGTVQSNEIVSSGTGVEVKAGITGLGLPGVELQFDQSAGDGATYRGKRVNQRSIDLLFHVYGPSRESLKGHLDRISLVLAHPCTVTWRDDDAGEAWQIVGYRSGGGDYAYGEDTDGKQWVNLTVTLQTETPYWESTATLVQTITSSRSVTINNPGTVASPPVWKVHGPTFGFTARSQSGEELRYAGLIDDGTTVTIDCTRGTVVDNYGANRYNDLGSMPQFWSLPEGMSYVAIDFDQTSDEYEAGYTEPRTNFVPDPQCGNPAAWDYVYGFSNDGTRFTQTDVRTDYAERPKLGVTLSGLEPGRNYILRVTGEQTAQHYPLNATVYGGYLSVVDGWVVKQVALPSSWSGEQTFEFTAESDSATVFYAPETALTRAKSLWARSSGYIEQFFVGQAGPYFDGDTPDTEGVTYSWTGTPNDSASTATPVVLPTDGASVTVEYKPRKWLVI